MKPGFWGSPKTAKVSLQARLLFLGLLNESDDEGRQLGSTRRITGALFPHDEDVSTRQVRVWLDELESAEFIVRYERDAVPYLLIVGFGEHQRVSHPTPSALPAPPQEPPEPLPKTSGAAPESFRPELEREREEEEEEEGELIAPNGAEIVPLAKSLISKRDLLWEAVLRSCGISGEITPSARGGYNRAVADIRKAGGTPEDVPARAAMHRAHWAHIKLTPSSLAKHWAECVPDAANLAGRTMPKSAGALMRVAAKEAL